MDKGWYFSGLDSFDSFCLFLDHLFGLFYYATDFIGVFSWPKCAYVDFTGGQLYFLWVVGLPFFKFIVFGEFCFVVVGAAFGTKRNATSKAFLFDCEPCLQLGCVSRF